MSRFRMVLSADWHLDAVTAGVERRDEIERAVMDGPVRAAAEGKADLFCFLGDLCDPGGRSAVHDAAFPIQVARALASAKVPSMWIAGNHDVVLCDESRTTLDPLATYAFAERVCVPVVTRDPCLFEAAPNLGVLALPYSHREQDRSILPAILDGLATRPYVALGHCTAFPGRDESPEFARGRAQPWPMLHRRPTFAANGHYHEQCELDVGGYSVHVPGSLVRLTMGDAESRRGFSIIDLEV